MILWLESPDQCMCEVWSSSSAVVMLVFSSAPVYSGLIDHCKCSSGVNLHFDWSLVHTNSDVYRVIPAIGKLKYSISILFNFIRCWICSSRLVSTRLFRLLSLSSGLAPASLGDVTFLSTGITFGLFELALGGLMSATTPVTVCTRVGIFPRLVFCAQHAWLSRSV